MIAIPWQGELVATVFSPDRVVMLNRGLVAADGPYAQLIASQRCHA